MSVNVPSRSLRYSAACVAGSPRPGHAVPLTSSRSCQPSPSTSSQRAPEPNVSGMYLAPKAPVLWVKRTPADSVTSVKTTGVAAVRTRAGTDAARVGASRRVIGVGAGKRVIGSWVGTRVIGGHGSGRASSGHGRNAHRRVAVGMRIVGSRSGRASSGHNRDASSGRGRGACHRVAAGRRVMVSPGRGRSAAPPRAGVRGWPAARCCPRAKRGGSRR